MNIYLRRIGTTNELLKTSKKGEFKFNAERVTREFNTQMMMIARDVERIVFD